MSVELQGVCFWYNDKGIKVCGKSELAGVKIYQVWSIEWVDGCKKYLRQKRSGSLKNDEKGAFRGNFSHIFCAPFCKAYLLSNFCTMVVKRLFTVLWGIMHLNYIHNNEGFTKKLLCCIICISKFTYLKQCFKWHNQNQNIMHYTKTHFPCKFSFSIQLWFGESSSYFVLSFTKQAQTTTEIYPPSLIKMHKQSCYQNWSLKLYLAPSKPESMAHTHTHTLIHLFIFCFSTLKCDVPTKPRDCLI